MQNSNGKPLANCQKRGDEEQYDTIQMNSRKKKKISFEMLDNAALVNHATLEYIFKIKQSQIIP